MGSIDKVNSLCVMALKITKSDLKAAEDMAKSQSGYVSPTQRAKQANFNDLGNHNQKVIAALKNLINVIKAGNPEK